LPWFNWSETLESRYILFSLCREFVRLIFKSYKSFRIYFAQINLMEPLKKQRKLNPEEENQAKAMEEAKEIDQRVLLYFIFSNSFRFSSNSRISKEKN